MSSKKNAAKSDDKAPDSPVSETVVAEGRKWRKVHKPVPWRPKKAGEAISGLYGGRHTRAGQFGPYEVLSLQTEDGMVYLSGTVLMTLLDGAGVLAPTARLRVVFLGRKELQNQDGEFKDYDLFVER